jgi:hypothetical protein
MKILLIASLLTWVLYSHSSADAATIHAPADSTAIQGAINSAIEGDTVLVAPGTSFKNCSAAIPVIRMGGTDGQVMVDYATSNGKALTGLDNDATLGTFRFLSGESSKRFQAFYHDRSTEGVLHF